MYEPHRTAVTFVMLALSAFGVIKPVREFKGEVVRVISGDRITLLDASGIERDIRLAEIDAPEIADDQNQSEQPFAKESRECLKDLIGGKQVRVLWSELDDDSRILGCVFMTDERGREIWVNLAMVKAGFAWHFIDRKKWAPSWGPHEMAAAQADAKEAKRGLWADAKALSPWEWIKIRDGEKGK